MVGTADQSDTCKGAWMGMVEETKGYGESTKGVWMTNGGYIGGVKGMDQHRGHVWGCTLDMC